MIFFLVKMHGAFFLSIENEKNEQPLRHQNLYKKKNIVPVAGHRSPRTSSLRHSIRTFETLMLNLGVET